MKRSGIARSKAIRQLRASEPDPEGEPKRYTDPRGYTRLRWRVGKGEYVERYERDDTGALTRAVESTAHRLDVDRVVELYASGLSTTQVAREVGGTAGSVSRALARRGVKARRKGDYHPGSEYRSEFLRKRKTILARSNGRCEAAIPGICHGAATIVHHRLMRSHGGDNSDENLLAVCLWCHLRIHDYPAASYEAGWLLRGVT